MTFWEAGGVSVLVAVVALGLSLVIRALSRRYDRRHP